MALGHEKLDVISKDLNERQSRERRFDKDHMTTMLNRLGKRGYSVDEDAVEYRVDFDYDFDETKSQSDAAPNGYPLRGQPQMTSPL